MLLDFDLFFAGNAEEPEVQSIRFYLVRSRVGSSFLVLFVMDAVLLVRVCARVCVWAVATLVGMVCSLCVRV